MPKVTRKDVVQALLNVATIRYFDLRSEAIFWSAAAENGAFPVSVPLAAYFPQEAAA